MSLNEAEVQDPTCCQQVDIRCGVGCTSSLIFTGNGATVPKSFDEHGFSWSCKHMANTQRFSEPSHMLQSMVKDGWIVHGEL